MGVGKPCGCILTHATLHRNFVQLCASSMDNMVCPVQSSTQQNSDNQEQHLIIGKTQSVGNEYSHALPVQRSAYHVS